MPSASCWACIRSCSASAAAELRAPITGRPSTSFSIRFFPATIAQPLTRVPSAAYVLSARTLYKICILVGVLLLAWVSSGEARAVANEKEEQVCDSIADYFLGMEDYPEAIAQHKLVITRQPGNALAHYHLGFAYGMIGRHAEELREYQRAIELGLSDWALFLNLGLLYMETNRLQAATDVLRLATLLGPNRPETHFNLSLVYERRGMLAQAEQEILVSLHLDPGQPDALNTLGVVYAEQGNYARAREAWGELLRNMPAYEPARTNLAILDRAQRGDPKAAASVAH